MTEGQDGDGGQVPDTGDDQQLHHAGVGVVDVLRVVEQFRVLDDTRQRGHFHHADELVAHWRNDDPHGLRQDDSAQRLQTRHADRLGGFVLAGVHREQAGAHHFGGVGTLVDAQTEQRSHERRHQAHGVDFDQAGDADGGEDQRQVEPQQQLQNQRRTAKQPGVRHRHIAQDRVGRHAHDRGDHPEHDAQRHRQHGHDDGVEQTPHDRLGGEELADVRPFDLAFGEGAHQADDRDDDHRGEENPPVVTPGHMIVLGDVELVFRQFALRLESFCMCLAHVGSPYCSFKSDTDPCGS
ncbi:hypothetical protein D3C71_1105130 [compost metagenome]